MLLITLTSDVTFEINRTRKSSYLIGIQRLRNLFVSALLYKMIMEGGLNLTPNFKMFVSCDMIKESKSF